MFDRAGEVLLLPRLAVASVEQGLGRLDPDPLAAVARGDLLHEVTRQAGDVVAPLAPQAGEVVVARQHGMTGFYESGLDAFLRNTGVRSVVLTGVSVNIGILGTAIEAVNRGWVSITRPWPITAISLAP